MPRKQIYLRYVKAVTMFNYLMNCSCQKRLNPFFFKYFCFFFDKAKVSGANKKKKQLEKKSGYKKSILESQSLLETKMGRCSPNCKKLHLQIVGQFQKIVPQSKIATP